MVNSSIRLFKPETQDPEPGTMNLEPRTHQGGYYGLLDESGAKP
jgi:hypothetical protein